MFKKRKSIALFIALLAMIFTVACGDIDALSQATQQTSSSSVITIESIPEYAGEPYIVLNNNEPDFDEEYFTTESFETYSDLDSLGRCGVAFANVGKDIMPTEERGSISQVKPTAWHSVKYDCVDGKHLYNRCHLIGFQLTGENANEKNLITGTRYLNVVGMLPFENMVADYVKETNNHVLYRVTPVFEGDNLLAKGVQIEAESVEDNGEDILFNVFCYNNQPGIVLDYKTGESKQATAEDDDFSVNDDTVKYILNTNSKKFHELDCSSVSTMKKDSKQEFVGTRKQLEAQGYTPCGICKP
ncbi:MAG: DNA/RNA non-specific endonuclease [Firmicutes bacterium]|jgi:DNA-entry nuclease|nr:DNA/RNA non-specific endonuclease [Bacillota bacterium]